MAGAEVAGRGEGVLRREGHGSQEAEETEAAAEPPCRAAHGP
jgi:hypothetical protein